MNAMPLSSAGSEPEVEAAGFPQQDEFSAEDGFRSEFPDYSYDPLDEPFVPSAPVVSARFCQPESA